MDPRDWERQRLHKCLQGDGVRGRVGMQVPEGQTRMLHHARCHCHQICPNKLWSPTVNSMPALPPLSSPTMGLPVVQSGQGPACEGVQTEPSLAPGREAAAEDRGPQSSAPFPLSPEGNGHDGKGSVCRALATPVRDGGAPGSSTGSSRRAVCAAGLGPPQSGVSPDCGCMLLLALFRFSSSEKKWDLERGREGRKRG